MRALTLLAAMACGAPDASPWRDAGHGMGTRGGRVLAGDLRVRILWVGRWDLDRAQAVTAAVRDASGSPYLRVLRTYPGPDGEAPSGRVSIEAEEHDAALGPRDVLLRVSGRDPGAVVAFLYAARSEAGLGGGAAGYHGNHRGVPYLVAADWPEQPIGWLVSVLLHELAEAATSPDLDGWTDADGLEVADKCWGGRAPVGVVRLGGASYLLPQLWLNADGGRCTLGE